MPRKQNSALILIALAFVLFFAWAGAVQARGLVPCGGQGEDPCNFCHLFQLTDNIIDALIFGPVPIVPVIAILMVVIGGVYLFFGGPSEENLKKGKSIIRNAIIGLVIVYAGWVVVGTILGFIVRGAEIGNFNFTASKGIVISCNLTEVKGAKTPTLPPAPSALCSDAPALAASYGTVYPRQNSPDLDAMISCIMSELAKVGPTEGGTYADLVDRSQLFTYEESNDLCNYTRGDPVCGNCAHAKNSCHYGGQAGTKGAEAVDFNSIKGDQSNELDLRNAIKTVENRGVCPTIGKVLFEKTDTNSWHTHVETKACSGGSGPSTRGPACAPLTSGPASVANLRNICFGANADIASGVSRAENPKSDPALASGADRCQPGKEAVSFGLFQINISANPITVGGYNLNCPKAFDRAFSESNKNCVVTNKALYDQCVNAITDSRINILTACQLSNNGTDWSKWGSRSRNLCRLP